LLLDFRLNLVQHLFEFERCNLFADFRILGSSVQIEPIENGQSRRKAVVETLVVLFHEETGAVLASSQAVSDVSAYDGETLREYKARIQLGKICILPGNHQTRVHGHRVGDDVGHVDVGTQGNGIGDD